MSLSRNTNGLCIDATRWDREKWKNVPLGKPQDNLQRKTRVKKSPIFCVTSPIPIAVICLLNCAEVSQGAVSFSCVGGRPKRELNRGGPFGPVGVRPCVRQYTVHNSAAVTCCWSGLVSQDDICANRGTHTPSLSINHQIKQCPCFFPVRLFWVKYINNGEAHISLRHFGIVLNFVKTADIGLFLIIHFLFLR